MRLSVDCNAQCRQQVFFGFSIFIYISTFVWLAQHSFSACLFSPLKFWNLICARRFFMIRCNANICCWLYSFGDCFSLVRWPFERISNAIMDKAIKCTNGEWTKRTQTEINNNKKRPAHSTNKNETHSFFPHWNEPGDFGTSKFTWARCVDKWKFVSNIFDFISFCTKVRYTLHIYCGETVASNVAHSLSSSRHNKQK